MLYTATAAPRLMLVPYTPLAASPWHFALLLASETTSEAIRELHVSPKAIIFWRRCGNTEALRACGQKSNCRQPQRCSLMDRFAGTRRGDESSDESDEDAEDALERRALAEARLAAPQGLRQRLRRPNAPSATGPA